jgi:NAD-dependent dihydropyrimidine dehydrogenase PreA subunit
MEREIIRIDEDKCDGCGLCVPNCHEGALQIIDEKAVLISDLMCDGLGACIGHCPQGALTIEKREAEAYDEVSVMKEMIRKGKNVVQAHLKHLKDHDEHTYLKEGVRYLLENKHLLEFDPVGVIQSVHNHRKSTSHAGVPADRGPSFSDNVNAGFSTEPVVIHAGGANGCPGSREMSFRRESTASAASFAVQPSALRQWPVQLHLINPAAGYFKDADLLISADCVAYAMGNFHAGYLRNKSLVIACPKLDSNLEIYRQKIEALIDGARVNTISVMIMEVPCCGGLLQMVKSAASNAERKVPVKAIQVSVEGEVLSEQWI